ncbi:universal stress protein, partial [Streptomyces sp. NPDC005921]
MFERILVAIDPSAARKTALLMAGELARSANATVHVLHVVTSMAAGDTVVKLEEEDQGEAILEEHRGTVAALFNPRISDAVAHTNGVAVLPAPEVR